MKAKSALTLGVIFVAGAGALLLSMRETRSDEELIRVALDDSIRAAKDGRSGSILDFISKNFTVNDEELLNRGEVARAIAQYKPEISYSGETIDVSGEMATMRTQLSLKASGPLPVGFNVKDSTIRFEKEQTTKWLVIPERKWRIVEVNLPGVSMPQFN